MVRAPCQLKFFLPGNQGAVMYECGADSGGDVTGSY